MLEKKHVDLITGEENVSVGHCDESSFDETNSATAYSSAEIDACICIFLTMTPFEFSDKTFVSATMKLQDMDFTKAVYKVYLRRECELYHVNLGNGLLTRMNAVANFRNSLEFRNLWLKKTKKKKNFFVTFLGRIWLEMTG
jgi:hypothetical protein